MNDAVDSVVVVVTSAVVCVVVVIVVTQNINDNGIVVGGVTDFGVKRHLDGNGFPRCSASATNSGVTANSDTGCYRVFHHFRGGWPF